MKLKVLGLLASLVFVGNIDARRRTARSYKEIMQSARTAQERERVAGYTAKRSAEKAQAEERRKAAEQARVDYKVYAVIASDQETSDKSRKDAMKRMRELEKEYPEAKLGN